MSVVPLSCIQNTLVTEVAPLLCHIIVDNKFLISKLIFESVKLILIKSYSKEITHNSESLYHIKFYQIHRPIYGVYVNVMKFYTI